MNDLISIIVPAYNSEKTIKRCIDSIANQSYKNIEIVVINDGSTDKTLDILYHIECKNIKIISIPNCGPAHARNVGIDNASGDWPCRWHLWHSAAGSGPCWYLPSSDSKPPPSHSRPPCPANTQLPCGSRRPFSDSIPPPWCSSRPFSDNNRFGKKRGGKAASVLVGRVRFSYSYQLSSF